MALGLTWQSWQSITAELDFVRTAQLANISQSACNQPYTADTRGSGIPIGTSGSQMAVSPGACLCCRLCQVSQSSAS